MSKLDDIVEADDCIAQALKKTPSLSTDQLIALAQVNATKALAHVEHIRALQCFADRLADDLKSAEATAESNPGEYRALARVGRTIGEGLGLL